MIRRGVGKNAILTAAVGGLLTACTSGVWMPVSVRDPAVVFLVEHDRHRGLALPLEDGRYVEYGFGEWEWYALGHDGSADMCGTLFWPTRGTLARRITHSKGAEAVRAELSWMVLHELRVERSGAAVLRDELGAEYAAAREQEVYNPDHNLHFVPAEDDYCLFYNCSDAVADWLERLDCEVGWVPVRLDFTVVRR